MSFSAQQKEEKIKTKMNLAATTTHQRTQSSQANSEGTRRTRSANKKNGLTDTKKSPILKKGKQINLGTSHQVALPEYKIERNEDMEEDKDECLWSKRNGKLSDEQIDEFCREARDIYEIEGERALYILHKSDYNLHKAKSELTYRAIPKEHFSTDDASAFRAAHIYFGKNFSKIHQVLPYKTLSALVEYYYLTKKQQNYKSFTDNEWAEGNALSNSDEEGQIQPKSEFHRLICESCHNEVLKLYSANGLELCRACKNYFKVMNKHRVSVGPVQEVKHVPICPPEMRNIAEQFEEMARKVVGRQFEDISNGSGEVQVEHNRETICEQKIRDVSKRQRKLQKDAIALQKRLTTDTKKFQHVLEEARKFVQNTAPIVKGQRFRLTHTWSEAEKRETLNALVRFDGNYKIVSEVLGTKTSDMVKSFYERNQKEISETFNKRREVIEKKIKEEMRKRKEVTTPEVIVVDD